MRYLFWGREEKANYAQSTRPWEREAKLVASRQLGRDLRSGSYAGLSPAESIASACVAFVPLESNTNCRTGNFLRHVTRHAQARLQISSP